MKVLAPGDTAYAVVWKPSGRFATMYRTNAPKFWASREAAEKWLSANGRSAGGEVVAVKLIAEFEIDKE